MKERSLILASVGTALGASVCCIGPFAAVVFGASSLAAMAAFEPVRPYFLATTLLLLGGSWYLRHRRTAAACADGSCPPAGGRSLPLWLAAGVIVVLIAFPYYAELLSRLLLGIS